MEALDDLLSDSDYEGPASKLGLGPRPSASVAASLRSSSLRGVAAGFLEPIEEPTEAPRRSDSFDDEYTGGDCDSNPDDLPKHHVGYEAFSMRGQSWKFSAMDLDAEPLHDDQDAEQEVPSNFSLPPVGISDMGKFDDLEELEKEIEALAFVAPSQQTAKNWWSVEKEEAHTNLDLGYGSEGGDSAEEESPKPRALDKASLQSVEADIAALLDDSKPAPAWAPPSSQTTVYEGGSQSPQSEVGTGTLERSSPSSPRSAETRRVPPEAELCGKSALVCGFERDSSDTGGGGSSVAAAPADSSVVDGTAATSDRTATGGAGSAPPSGLRRQCSTDSAAASSAGEGNAAATKSKTFLKKGSRMPRSVVPAENVNGRGATAQAAVKARAVPRLMPRASSSPPASSRTSDLPADEVPPPIHTAATTGMVRGGPPVARHKQEIQVEVRVPLSAPPLRGAEIPPAAVPSPAQDSPDVATATGEHDTNGYAYAHSSGFEGGEYDESTVPAADAPDVSQARNVTSPCFGSAGSSGIRPPLGSSTGASGVAAFAAAAASRAAASPAFGTNSNIQSRSGAENDEWADTLPWDCRGSDPALDLELDLDAGAPNGSCTAPLPGEPPTSRIVKSYFNSAKTPGDRPTGLRSQPVTPASRHSHWEGADAYSVLYGSSAGQFQRSPATPEFHGAGLAPEFHEQQRNEAFEEEEKQRLEALDQQIQKCKKESEMLKKLRGQVEQAERDGAREREKLAREVEAERNALHAEFDAEHAALKRERRRLTQGAERQRQQITEDREAAEERKRLRERTEQLEEELREKDKRWTRTVDRLQRQVCDLTRKNQELEEEVKRSGLQVQQAQFGPVRSASATTSARGRRPSLGARARTPTPNRSTRTQGAGAETGPSWQAWQAQNDASRPSSGEPGLRGRPSAESLGTEHVSSASRIPLAGSTAYNNASSVRGLGQRKVGSGKSASRDIPRAEEAGTEVREVRNKDGKTERLFWNGGTEIEFANGLRKMMHPDGKTQVLFQNGDEKEIRPDGVIVYHYAATKAVQTTLPDGVELYQFQDGQFERHHPDGSTEIHFPNGTTKRIQSDGSEEVTFSDGTVRRTPCTSHIASE